MRKDRQTLGCCLRTKKNVEHASAIIPFAVGILGTVLKGLIRGLEQKIEGKIETIPTTALLR